ncbi:hypothetical protein BDV26DRAFT_301955 [Aspergillus bertholletiae]|uniref:Frag1/DRAM/Sfk1 family-domain-containing protein n=1 Tax=Aspergillus bertholletiae TaxID=1226010 RepID=A0A5N7BHE1_9EURO|nr:hypothetical protein BDV26DRAFT_301955 [Aspergillus bertholletiae]
MMDFWRREGGGECELVGEEMATLVGNGVLVGFAGQAALSLGLSAWVFFLTKHGNMDITYPEGSVKREIERKRLDFVSNILMIGSDIQSTLGISYMITVFSQAEIMDTYHLHLVFDIVSFVGVSNTAALVCWRFCRAKIDASDNTGTPKRISYFHSRYRATFIFTVLYLTHMVLLCVRLGEWAPDVEPGRCYFSHLVTSPSASHPRADQIYVTVTGTWLIMVLLASIFTGVKGRRFILILSSLHFPLHLYMAIALRQANQGKFAGETKHENEWDFGQTTAVVLLGIAVVELITKGREYYHFEKHVTKYGKPPDTSDPLPQEDEESNRYPLATLSGDEQAPEEKRLLAKRHTAI